MLKGKVALVTGAGNGIGSVVSKRLSELGAHVFLLDKDKKGLEGVYDEIEAAGGSSTAIEMDLNDLATMQKLPKFIASRFGCLDIMVCNAALLGSCSPLQDYSYEVWQKIMHVNLTANWLLLKNLDVLLRLSSGARLVFVSDAVAKLPKHFMGPYAISKAGLESMASIYAMENNKTKMKVSIVEIESGVNTALYRSYMPGVDRSTLRQPADLSLKFDQFFAEDLLATGERYCV